MTKRRFAGRLAFAVFMTAAFAVPSASAQQRRNPAAKPGKLINAGDVLSGELTAIKARGGKRSKRVASYQITVGAAPAAAAERAVQSGDGPGDVPARHHQRGAGRAVEGLCRQGDLGQGRRGLLRAGCRADERSRDHEVERGDEAVDAVMPAAASLTSAARSLTGRSWQIRRATHRRVLDSITDVSGILGPPVKPGDDEQVATPAPSPASRNARAAAARPAGSGSAPRPRRRSRRTAASPSPSPRSRRPKIDRCARPRRGP